MADPCRLLKAVGAYMFFATVKSNASPVIRTLAYLLVWFRLPTSQLAASSRLPFGWGQQVPWLRQPPYALQLAMHLTREVAAKRSCLVSLDGDNKYQGGANYYVPLARPVSHARSYGAVVIPGGLYAA